MNFKLIFGVVFLFLITACKTQSKKTEASVSNKTIILGIGKSFTIPNTKTVITFQNIAEDSRCPVNTTCVWEGVAIVNLYVKSDNKTENLKLATRDFEPKNANKMVDHNGYTLTLVDVSPKPGEKGNITKSITIRCEKSDDNTN